jgi:predicted ATPase
MNTDLFYIITGGPGVGKTTLLQQLHQRGYQTIPEDARRIIQQQIIEGGNGLPWKNRLLYAQLMLTAAIETYQKVKAKQIVTPVFFDRSIIDTLCYMKMESIAVTEEYLKSVAKCVYHPKVFILPPWREIYRTDNERRQTWKEAEYTFQQMKKTYLDRGYQLIEVPAATPEIRANFVLDCIGY